MAVALVLGALGHAFLVPATGARPPSEPRDIPEAVFSPLVLGPDSKDVVGAADDRGDVAVGVDEWGLIGSPGQAWDSDVTPAPPPTAAPEPAEVVRFRPRNGWTGVDRSAQLSVRFTTAMDRATTEATFHATIDGKDLTGTRRWAEGDTVLVLRPSAAMPYSARVELRVELGARSAAGVALQRAAAVTFTVEARPPAPVATGGGGSASGWQWPLLGPITQYFGQSLTQYGVHQGIDIDGDTGDPVRAAKTGRVVLAGYADECGGLQVRVDHGGGLLTWYRHLSAIETAVGARVAAGTVVGRVGNTGCSLGSHLHFGVSQDGTFKDPLRYLPAR